MHYLLLIKQDFWVTSLLEKYLLRVLNINIQMLYSSRHKIVLFSMYSPVTHNRSFNFFKNCITDKQSPRFRLTSLTRMLYRKLGFKNYVMYIHLDGGCGICGKKSQIKGYNSLRNKMFLIEMYRKQVTKMTASQSCISSGIS